MRYVLALLAFAAVAFGQQTLTCTFQFTGSGKLGTSTFADAAITITTVGNTANRYVVYDGSVIRNDSTSISISGMGTFQFLSPSQLSNLLISSADQPTIALTDIGGNVFVQAPNNQYEWDMLAAMGPFTFSGTLSPYGVAPQALTNAGTLTFNEGYLPIVFRATIATPEQPYLAITAVTSAAIPGMDIPAPFASLPRFPASIHFAPRSMATIYGTNLAGSNASATSPWNTTLGGTEVHLVSDACSSPSCELIASLIYASPTQINFLVPDDQEAPYAVPIGYRIVFVQNGQRIDNRYSQGAPGYPG
jgi:hypothetical protein